MTNPISPLSAALPPLLPASIVHDARYVLIWLLLTFAAGSVNATALAASQRFVTHVTGTLTRVGADFGEPTLMLEYTAVLLAFVLGAMTSVLLIDGRRLRNREPKPVAPLALVSLVLACVAGAGMANLFGEFGVGVETAPEFVMLGALAFAMGLQNASVATTTGMIVRTTHMTGPMTDFSIALATMFSGGPEPLMHAARRGVALRGSKILAFFAGALVASAMAPELHFATFLVPAGVMFGAAILLHRAIGARVPTGHPSPSVGPVTSSSTPQP